MRAVEQVGRTWVVALSTFIALLLTLPGFALAGAPPPASPVGTDETGHTLVYNELTTFTASPNSRGEESPILSDDGQHIAYAMAPGTGDPATPNQIFLMNADGTGQQQVDSYTSLCYCGSTIDLSADGSRIISTDSTQLRIADASGSIGRQLIALNSNEINAARISGDGSKVFFRLHRDASIRDTSPSQPIERGVWVINADGSGLRQLVSPHQLEALGLPPTDFVASSITAFDTSTDGSRLVFGAFHDPKEGGVGQGLFAVNADGSGLHELVGRVNFVNSAAISGDGTTVAYSIADQTGERVEVVPFDGGTPRTLTDRTLRLPVVGSGVVDDGDRMQLSADGNLALLGSSGVLADTQTGELLALGVAGPTLIPGAVPIVGDGLYQATMDTAADRVLYFSGDANNILQLSTVDLDPADLGSAPNLSDATITPSSILEQTGSSATAQVHVTTTGTLQGVGASVLQNGLLDPNTGIYGLADDGSHGDTTPNDNLFTNTGITTNCCATIGPRTIRFEAQILGPDGRRHATAIDIAPFAVTPAAPTATPTS